MKFFKVLLNSLISGFFFSALLALLVYDLNINLGFELVFLGQVSIFHSITYGLLISFFCFLIFFIIQFFLEKKFQIAFVSPSFLMASFTLLFGLFLLIFRENYKYFHSLFTPETSRILKTQFAIFSGLIVFGVLSFYFFHSTKKHAVFLWTYFVLFVFGLSVAIYLRSLYPPLPSHTKTAVLEARSIDKKITIIGMKGLSFDFLIPLINEKKLPNFSWLMEEGTWGKMNTFSPTEPVVLDSSFNTGKLPALHRQISPYRYRLINARQEIEVVPRYIFFRQMIRTPLLKVFPNSPSLETKDIWKIFEDNKTSFLKRTFPSRQDAQQRSPKAEALFNLFYKDIMFEKSPIFKLVKNAFLYDADLEEKIFLEKNKTHPQMTYFFLSGLNIAQAYFYKYNFPELFGDIDQELIRKYSPVIERYYHFYDQIIGKHLTSLKEDEILLVYSPHGIEPLPLWKRIVEWILGNADISAYHDNAPDGVFFLYGKEITRGNNIEGMRLIDVTPTLLNYLGLPVGKDMDGIVFSSVFRESFKRENPVLYISSYEEIAVKSPSP